MSRFSVHLLGYGWVTDNSQLVPIVQCAVTPFPTFGDKCYPKPTLPPKLSHVADELVAFHEAQYRTNMTD